VLIVCCDAGWCRCCCLFAVKRCLHM
jgi:hypothetical protein